MRVSPNRGETKYLFRVGISDTYSKKEEKGCEARGSHSFSRMARASLCGVKLSGGATQFILPAI
jgi:hypothetical protein